MPPGVRCRVGPVDQTAPIFKSLSLPTALSIWTTRASAGSVERAAYVWLRLANVVSISRSHFGGMCLGRGARIRQDSRDLLPGPEQLDRSLAFFVLPRLETRHIRVARLL